MRCPDDGLLAARVDDEVDAETAEWLDDHVEGCDSCLRLVRAHRQVKRRTSGLAALPSPAPQAELVAALLRLPAVEHTRAGRARCSQRASGPNRLTSLAVGTGVGAGLVALVWLAPLTSGAAGPSTTPPGASPAEAPRPTVVTPVSSVPSPPATGASTVPPAAVPVLASWSPAGR